MPFPRNNAPAFYSAIGICLGILSGYFLFPEHIPIWVFSVSALFVFAGIVLSLLKHRSDLAVSLASLLIGCILGHNSIPNPLPSEFEDTKCILTGRVTKVTTTPGTIRAVMDVSEVETISDSTYHHADFKILCVVYPFSQNIEEHATLKVSGKLKPLEQNSDVPMATDYNRFLYLDGIVGRMNIYDKDDISIDDSSIPGFYRFINAARDTWFNTIIDAGFDEQTTSFMLTVLGGDDSLLNDDIAEEYRQTGLAHILAISGMHVAIIMMVLCLLFYPIKLVRRLRPAYFVIIGILIVFFALISGGSPSACRAAAMGCVLMGNRLFEVRSNPLQSLATAMVILLCFKPLWLLTPGFQFSVCAVLSIIAFSPVLNVVPRRYRIGRLLWTIVIIPVIAMAGTLLLTIFYYHEFSLNFWLANIVAAILIPPLLVAGFIAVIITLCGASSSLLADSCNAVYGFMNDIIQKISELFPNNTYTAYLEVRHFVIIGIILLICIWTVNSFSWRKLGITAFCIIAGIIMLNYDNEEHSGTEIYIPRHSGQTDVIIARNGRSYLWTSAKNYRDFEAAIDYNTTNYADFYNSRGLSDSPIVLTDSFEETGIKLKANILWIDGHTIARIDNDSSLTPDNHVNIALVSEHYDGKLFELAKRLDADSIFLSRAIHPSRLQKFIRQLDTLNVAFRSLDKHGFVWQSKQ